MKKTWIVIALAAAFCSACADKDDAPLCINGENMCMAGVRYTCQNDAFVLNACPLNNTCVMGDCIPNTDGCQDGVSFCDGANVKYCSGGMWKTTDCSGLGGCSMDSGVALCVSNDEGTGSKKCTDGAKRCGMKVRQICVAGQWVDSACSDGLSCSDGECVACTSGSKRCGLNNTTEECQAGQWVTTNVCTGNSTCNEGKCIDPTACSKEGAKQCGQANDVQVCTAGTWVTTAVCTSAGADKCVLGECLDSRIPQYGDACTEKTPSACYKNELHYCGDNGKISTYKCPSNSICYVDDEGDADCGEICTSVGAVKNSCQPATFTNGTSGFATFVFDCTNTSAGLVYVVNYDKSMVCNGGCNAAGDACDTNGGNGGGSGAGWSDCSSETCTMQDGTEVACGVACKQYGGSSEAKAWCSATGEVSCSDPGNSGSAGSYQKCDDTCKVEGGVTCAQYCKSQGSDVCYMDDQYLYCNDPNESGSGGASDGYEDCSDEKCSMSDGSTIACGLACKQYGGSSEAKAWCDAKGNVSCTNPGNGGGSSNSESCNESSYVESCNGLSGKYCYEGKVEDFTCDASAPCKVSVSGVADCASACTAAQANTSVGYYCYDYMGMATLAISMVCQATKDGSYAAFLDEDAATECKNGCNETKGCL